MNGTDQEEIRTGEAMGGGGGARRFTPAGPGWPLGGFGALRLGSAPQKPWVRRGFILRAWIRKGTAGSASLWPASPETRQVLQVYLGFAAGVRAVSFEAKRGLKTIPGSLHGAPGVTRGCSPLARQDAVLRGSRRGEGSRPGTMGVLWKIPSASWLLGLRATVLPCRKIRGSKTREPTWCIVELREGVIKGGKGKPR